MRPKKWNLKKYYLLVITGKKKGYQATNNKANGEKADQNDIVIHK